MSTVAPDDHTADRKALDEAIAAAAEAGAAQPQPPFPPGTAFKPMETFLKPKRKPLAVAGIVENGMIRLLDPTQKLPEHSHVVVVAAG